MNIVLVLTAVLVAMYAVAWLAGITFAIFTLRSALRIHRDNQRLKRWNEKLKLLSR